MNQGKRLYIVGHSGAGKALVAKAVAERLGWQFIDADFCMEFRIGRNLDEILGQKGQECFYQCQSEILLSQASKENIVVTTDACIVCWDKNRQLLAEAMVVFLQVSPSKQEERTTKSPAALLPINDINFFLEKQHIERDELYVQVADLVINSDENTIEDHVNSIVQMLSR